MTDWSILAEPQADGSDTEEILAMIDLAGFRRSPPAGQTLLGAEVRDTLDFTPKIEGLRSTVLSDDDIKTVENFVGAWPEMDRQLRSLLSAVYPVTRSQARAHSGGSYGTRNSDVANHFGEIYATTDSLYGFAEGLVSSIANWKLYSTGVFTDTWDQTLLLNATSEKCELPLRSGEMLPIGATLHATYAITHVLSFYLHLYRAGYRGSEVTFAIKQGAARIARGKAELDKSIRASTSGEALFTALDQQQAALINEADQVVVSLEAA